MKAVFLIRADRVQADETNSQELVTLDFVGQRLTELGLTSDSQFVVRGKKEFLELTVFAQNYRLQKLPLRDNDQSIELRLTKPGAFIDRLLGRNPFDENDAFVRLLQEILEREMLSLPAEVAVVWK